jgi:CheY-like chemotaxis protein
MRMALMKTGFPLDLQCAHNGHEALAGLRGQGGQLPVFPRPDLILLDLKMPGKGGLEMLQAIKQNEQLRAIPVVVITTSALPADVSAAYRLGAAGYVLKAVDLNEFIASMQTLAAYWFSLVCLPKGAE